MHASSYLWLVQYVNYAGAFETLTSSQRAENRLAEGALNPMRDKAKYMHELGIAGVVP